MSELPQNIDTNNPEFQDALRLIQHTNSSVFLTGRAGTGKSTFLKYVCNNTHKKHIVLAPTGIAAINAGGVTIHSFFKVPFRPILPNDPDLSTKDRRIYDFLKYNKAKMQLIREVELIIIDEISMVRCDILDFIDQVLRVYTGNKTAPFGGKQMLLVGDAFQLEPVVKRDEWQILNRFYRTPYFFSAQVFSRIPLVQIELQKVYRQNDPVFVNILDKIRVKSTTDVELKTINSRLNPHFQTPIDELFITLATRRDTVDYINDQKLNELEGEEFSFEGTISGEFPESSLPTLKRLILKENAQVMFVKNDIERRWFNGSLGIVEEIDEDGIYVRLENDNIHLVTKEKWENLRYKYDEKNNRIIAEEIGSFNQFPLRLAWAVTVHKSQGLTFDKVVIDFSGGAFAGGQLYVALSRCRSLEGMVLKTPVIKSDIIVNNEVVQFAKAANNKQLIEEELRKAKADSAYLMALGAFRSQNWQDAVKHFSKAVSYRNDLDKAEMQRFIVRELQFINHYKHRISDLEAQLEANRNNVEEFAREYYLMANECEVKFNDTRSAIANLNKALKLNPLFIEALLRRAVLLTKTGDYQSAETDCSSILKQRQRHFKALLLRGEIRLELNKLSGAYQDLLEAVNLRNSNPKAYKILSKVCTKMGETKKAKEYKNIAKSLENEQFD
ncbi:AAA family ATPase [Natronoflexus pectinivorans]|uniref:UvrD-like helicase family protein n=1 Tax=Natronoflexus pectinivorans TaxID=682526 RepID=A0A4R2G7J7_9BACT|nr:AAA family ATPase [Natronoflexus pectinivorans]TCO03640.1 UvrD-like helicase family protein [Natronoflexus pectinivorans]